MAKTTGIGLIGCGTIGAALAMAVARGEAGPANVTGLYDLEQGRANDLAARLNGAAVHATVDLLLRDEQVQTVVEAASQAAAVAHARAVLAAGRSLLLMSSGALIDSALFGELAGLARKHGVSLAVPSGAVGGLDAIRAVRSELREVRLTSTKPPAALRGAPGYAAWESKEIRHATVVYEGAARDAVRLFPANVNVAAAVSLAGLGPDRTMTRVVADPAAPGNVHEVSASGDFGQFTLRFVNRPSPENPRTSRLAILSAVEALRGLCDDGPRIGS
ncbi:MAG: aspartate dehydrogenase [Chloroflexi bacterium]|nr:aspartate dehydrogenase [Chloroflexota bacterium]